MDQKAWDDNKVQSALKKMYIASPCSVPTSSMEDLGNCRHCHECNLNVYMFHQMTNQEIALVLNEENVKICASMFKREDGSVITQDCPIGLKDIQLIYKRNGFQMALVVAFISLLMTLSIVKSQDYLSKQMQSYLANVFTKGDMGLEER